MIIVPVPLADGRSYDVIVGDGAVHELGTLIPAKAKRAAIVTQDSIPVQVETGIEQRMFTTVRARPTSRYQRSRRCVVALPSGG